LLLPSDIAGVENFATVPSSFRCERPANFPRIENRGNKSEVLIVEESINIDQYIQNFDELRLIDAVDQKHVLFDWMFE
jgi:hypothetical protein